MSDGIVRGKRTRREFVKAGITTLGALAAAGSLTEILAACGNTEKQIAAPAKVVKGGHFVEGYLYDVSTLNPIIATGRTTNQLAATMLFDDLLTYDTNGALVANLAKSVPKPSSDGLTYVFELRDGLKWTDGSPLTADDVAFTYQIQSDPSFKDVTSVNRSVFQTYIAKVEAPNPGRVVFTLTKPYAPLVQNYLWFGVLPKKVFAGMNGKQIATAEFNSNPTISSGVMKFQSWTKGQTLTLVRNDAYHGGAANIDSYVFKYVPDINTLANQLRTGEVDFGSIPNSQIGAFGNEQSLRVLNFAIPEMTFCFVQMDPTKPAFQILGDKSVRQALLTAIDRQGMVNAVYFKQAVIAWSPILPGTSWAYDPGMNGKYSYDKKKAGDMLDAAGWKVGPNGIRQKNGIPMKLRIDVANAQPFMDDAQVCQQAWHAIGVDASVRVLATPILVAESQNTRDFDIILTEFNFTGPDPDPTNSLSSAAAAPGGNNSSGYKNERVDQLLAQAVFETDRSKRKEIYYQIQQTVVDDLPRFPLVTAKQVYAVNKRVQGLNVGPFTRFVRPWMKNLWLSDGK